MRTRENDKMIGNRYNKWEVIGWERGKKGIEWVCRCECGEVKVQKVDNVKSGRSRMCKRCSVRERRERLDMGRKMKIIGSDIMRETKMTEAKMCVDCREYDKEGKRCSKGYRVLECAEKDLKSR